MCDNLKKDRIRCDICRTINLAKQVKRPKPDMQIYEKCTPEKICSRVSEFPVNPACIKVCTPEEYTLSKKPPPVVRMPHYAHGKLMYAVKAGILVGSIYFTYTQGVWGDQQEVVECTRRWQEYLRSINTRQPPVFDPCGKVAKIEKPSLLTPINQVYKETVTSFFSGIVKIPLLIKCAYFDYLNAMEKKAELEAKKK